MPFERHSSFPFQLQNQMQWSDSRLDLRFVLQGPLASLKGLVSHDGASAHPTDGLWQSTCFEAFFGVASSSAYYEINLAADGRWMVFSFESERQGQRICPEFAPTQFQSRLSNDRFEISASFDFAKGPELTGQTLAATPASVLQLRTGEISYWSLTHTKSKPDFHAPVHRVLELKPS